MLESNTSKLGQVLFWAAWGALSATEWVPWPACGCPTPHSHSRLLQQHLCGSVPKSQKFYSYKSDDMAEQQVILRMERMEFHTELHRVPACKHSEVWLTWCFSSSYRSWAEVWAAVDWTHTQDSSRAQFQSEGCLCSFHSTLCHGF